MIICHRAARFHALDLQNLSFSNVYCQVIRYACFALSMTAAQSEHVTIIEEPIAYWTLELALWHDLVFFLLLFLDLSLLFLLSICWE